ncbi:hypothetical protein OC835_006686 [Tilletia horrida]|uniref:Uncharacterized protein n=1 Tax=Tilletia horrida TaxID=155126 RepID=A0AAN6GCU1_9BASI|nr:hypothetical protein OC835_006686 [Tilletia horrida]KAK0531980.1 hypothetical protein OC842_003442 [Tilletia horrida]KAK0559874.1 hypothetical protein OC844_004116 [Tilletia horrida]
MALPLQPTSYGAAHTARDLRPSDEMGFNAVLVVRGLLAPRGDTHKVSKQSQKVVDHSQAGLDLLNKHKDEQKLPKEVWGQLATHLAETKKALHKVVGAPATHGPGSSGTTSSAASKPQYDGKVSKLPKDAPPHRNGKPSSGGEAGSSGRHR